MGEREEEDNGFYEEGMREFLKDAMAAEFESGEVKAIQNLKALWVERSRCELEVNETSFRGG